MQSKSMITWLIVCCLTGSKKDVHEQQKIENIECVSDVFEPEIHNSIFYTVKTDDVMSLGKRTDFAKVILTGWIANTKNIFSNPLYQWTRMCRQHDLLQTRVMALRPTTYKVNKARQDLERLAQRVRDKE